MNLYDEKYEGLKEAKIMIVEHEGRTKIAVYDFWCPGCTKRTFFYLTNNGRINAGVRLHERGLKQDWTIARIIDWGGGNFMIPLDQETDIKLDRFNTLSLWELFNSFKFADGTLETYRDPNEYRADYGDTVYY